MVLRRCSWALLMHMIVTSQAAGIRRATVGNGSTIVFQHHFDVEVHHPLPGDAPTGGAHTMRSMTDGAGETVVDVTRVLRKRRIVDDLVQVVTLGTQSVGTVEGQVGTRKEVGNRPTSDRSLAEFITPFQDMGPA